MSVPRCPLWVIVLLSGLLTSTSKAQGPVPSPEPKTPLSLAEAPKRMTVPEGFRVTLFAGEPDVRQPIAFTVDRRGRLWVVENFSYPEWLQPPKEKDRVVIFEDTDGDGHFDRRKVFWDQGNTVTGIALGFGGVWLCATPNLLFIPDKDADDVPDGSPTVVLDGWDVNARHNLFNGLNWAPDGWLWGCNGILSNSKVGKPGAPDPERVVLNCGVWRYHPTRGVFEAVAHGTTNPWGLDFDDYGEAFITNCVIPHLFHVVPGAHFQRMFGQDVNPHSYGLIASCADHIHWAGGDWTDSRGGKGKHGEAGGGHAHVGAMIYLGDNWPDEYRNSAFMCNIHGHRVNRDTLQPRGSGYVARHEKDFLFANDEWFRGLELKAGPDGGVFVTDWTDTGECHETDGDVAHRENGRIYKVTYGTPKPLQVDLARLSDLELARLQTHKNEWHVRQARLILQERAAAGRDMRAVQNALRGTFREATSVPHKLRALWALHAVGGAGESDLVALLKDPNDRVRGWAVRLIGEGKAPSKVALAALTDLTKRDESPRVRLEIAALLQRLSPALRWELAEALVSHAEDATDAYLPLMTWYGIEPLVAADPSRALNLAAVSRYPLPRQFLARRLMVEQGGPALVARFLESTSDNGLRLALLKGMREALRGRKDPGRPDGWESAFRALLASNDAETRQEALLVGVSYGDALAISTFRSILIDRSTGSPARRTALEALTEKRVAGLAAQLQTLLDDPELRSNALRALAAFDDPATPGLMLARYKTFTAAEREDAVNSLSSRPAYALELLKAVEKGTVSARDLSVATVRQLQALPDRRIATLVEAVWGSVRPTSREKTALIAKYKGLLTADALKAADRSRGRDVFQRTCAQCHRLFDAGGDVGPDLTGSDRANLDYVLENVLDPSATVGRDFRLNTLATRDGRVVSGIIREQSEATVTIQTVNERLVLDRQEIEDLKALPTSMMPEGIFEKLSPEEICDLVAYLGAKSQVPAPAATKP
ncbi:MAG: c-type cytochrome [Isosphaeraceae bacterium]|nr:c-type cytochrome [Isosphaeraceae bacterium]